MFESMINDLKTKEILSTGDVKELRDYIKNKYPMSNGKQVSLILADAIKKVISNNISQFDDCYKQAIRDRILQKTIQKQVFSVNAEDIFTSCLALNIVDDDYISALTNWINSCQNVDISESQIKEIVDVLSNKDLPQEQLELIEDTEKQEVYKQCKAKVNLNNCLISYINKMFGWLKTNTVNYKIATVLLFFMICGIALSFNSNSIITADSGIESTEEQILDFISIRNILDKRNSKNSQITEYIYDIESDIHKELKYQAVDKNALMEFLQSRNSILAQEPFFTTIIGIAEDYDVNPLLMFAITGQEQGFVPADLSQARKIANNPFNVCGSWQKYNTDISDSSTIAARTILNLGKNRPVYRDPIEWINRKYAEDKNWWKNVRQIFEMLKGQISYIK